MFPSLLGGGEGETAQYCVFALGGKRGVSFKGGGGGVDGDV